MTIESSNDPTTERNPLGLLRKHWKDVIAPACLTAALFCIVISAVGGPAWFSDRLALWLVVVAVIWGNGRFLVGLFQRNDR